MGFSDERIEQLVARLDAGETIEPETVRELLEEIKAGRRLVGKSAECIDLVKRAALVVNAKQAEDHEHERERDLQRNRLVSAN